MRTPRLERIRMCSPFVAFRYVRHRSDAHGALGEFHYCCAYINRRPRSGMRTLTWHWVRVDLLHSMCHRVCQVRLAGDESWQLLMRPLVSICVPDTYIHFDLVKPHTWDTMYVAKVTRYAAMWIEPQAPLQGESCLTLTGAHSGRSTEIL